MNVCMYVNRLFIPIYDVSLRIFVSETYMFAY